MATSVYGIATYEDLYNEFGVSDTALPIPYDQCPTYQQIIDNFPELQITGNYQSNQLVTRIFGLNVYQSDSLKMP